MKRFFIEYFQFNDWANDRVIESLKAIQNPPPKCVSIISHIISAQDVWLERISGNHNWNIEVWEPYSIYECSVLSLQSSEGWIKFIRKSREKDFDNLICYKNTKGNEYETPVREIMAHVLNHSSYHRGQINQVLKENNFSPVSIDYIFYTRI
jgi:uncharacterized damage-inducible protein DinB